MNEGDKNRCRRGASPNEGRHFATLVTGSFHVHVAGPVHPRLPSVTWRFPYRVILPYIRE